MPQQELADPKLKNDCVVRLDRLRFVLPRDGFSSVGKPPAVPGFRIVADTFVRTPKGKRPMYRRVRRMENPLTGTKIQIQYSRAHGFLKDLRVTVIGHDSTGIQWPELEKVGDAFGDFLVRMVEIAFDFSRESGVDLDFVRRHGKFGKSRSIPMKMYPGYLRFGTRKSPKMIRCYWKEEVKAFRVELEFHSSFPTLPQTDCLLYLLSVDNQEFSFVRVDWKTLDVYLNKKGTRGKEIAAEARARYTSLQRLLRYLRKSGVNNPHRFLRVMKKDELIRRAIDAWCRSMSPGIRNRKVEVEDEGTEN
jgi:hypothetical protein